MEALMFHSVGNDGVIAWKRHHLSVPAVQVENFCRFLKKNNYNTVHLDEWYHEQSKPDNDTGKVIALTFDDGYLDNWVFAWPILKKYNLKGTIFINPEFVDPGNTVRSTLEDVWAGKIRQDALQTLGFLNWPEIQAMDASGVMDIQSHSMSHNFYFHSDKIVDIYTGQPKYDWPAWYIRPERKPFYITEDQTGFVPQGYPIFEFGRALGLRRYFPDEKLVEYAVNRFIENGQQDKVGLISLINEKVKEWPGRFETDAEMEERYRYELFESKRILEEKLNKKVEFLCWPGGGYNELSVRLSVEAGYKASTIASREKKKVVDNSGEYKRIQRFGMGSFLTINGKRMLIKDKNYLVQNFKARTGSLFHKNLYRTRKLFYMLKEKF
jgi:peptidoglycan/xylan/chitin deacetylase (PgdA/CDA1 family)